MKNYLKHGIGWTLLASMVFLNGCQTADQADSGAMASVEISHHTKAEIQRAVAEAFQANHYQSVNRLTYEKQGTGWDKAAYGGWSSNPVWIRMRVNIASTGPSEFILACNAFAVVDRNQGGIEEEKKLSVSYRSECKKILDDAKALLDSPNAAAQ
ncbi:MAG: hypothetical protein WDM80_15990 [Limisphaerales bacterium]